MPGFHSIAVLPGASLSDDALIRLATLSERSLVMVTDAGDADGRRRPYPLTEVDVLICGWADRVDTNLLRMLPALRYIGLRGTNTSRIDLEYAGERGIVVRPIFNYGDTGAAEFVVEQMLGWARGTPLRDGQHLQELANSTLGLVGYGSVAKRVAKAAVGLEMRVLFHTPTRRSAEHGEWQPLGSVLAQADVVSVHTPANCRSLTLRDLRAVAADALVVMTTLGLPCAVDDLLAWQPRRVGRVVLDRCAAYGVPEAALRAPGIEVVPVFAARTRQSIHRAEAALLADLEQAADGDAP